MLKLTTKNISQVVFLVAIVLSNCLKADLAQHNNPKCEHFWESECLDKDVLHTDAGDINFEVIKAFSENGLALQKVDKVSLDDHTVTLHNGSVWKVHNIDAVRGWDKQKHLVITQNHAKLSTSKLALVNMDLGLAEPITLLTPPTPNHKDVQFIKKIDPTHDVIVLNNDKEFSVHNKDHGTLNKFNVNCPVIVGVNTMDQDTSNPYIIMDVSLNSHGYVRAMLGTHSK